MFRANAETLARLCADRQGVGELADGTDRRRIFFTGVRHRFSALSWSDTD
jgi:hypothetical protein